MASGRRTAVITGGTSGIGAATARSLAAEGVRVYVGARREPQDDLLADEHIRFVPADVTDAGQVAALVERAVAGNGRLDFAVNCAGYEGEFHTIGTYPEDDCRRVIDINLIGVLHSLKYEVRAMQKSGGGSIVNLSSIAGLKGVPMAAPYAAAKHAVIGATRSVALEVVADRVRVNAVCPALVDTGMAGRLVDKTGLSKQDLAAASPMGRAASPEEVVAAIRWLLSDRASFVTGQAISIDGGQAIA